MVLVYVIVPGLTSFAAAGLALLLGASVPVVLACYVLSGAVMSGVCVLLAALRELGQTETSDDSRQIELELAALRESARRDLRMGAGSPDALAPVLYRNLVGREAWLQRKRKADISLSDYVIAVQPLPRRATRASFWRPLLR